MNEDKNLNAKILQKCFCALCGKELTTEMKYCPYCGRANVRYNYSNNK